MRGGADETRLDPCAETRGLFAAYLDEELTREERSSVREHLAVCAGCRREASADPAFLFAGLSAGDAGITAADTAKILEAVRAGIGLKTVERRIRDSRRGGRSWARPAMTAAAAIAAAVLAWRFAPRTEAARTTGVSRLSAAVRPAATAASAPSTPEPPRSAPFALGPGGLEPANVKGNVPGDATIYDWNPGGGQPRVVWIVDRSLDI